MPEVVFTPTQTRIMRILSDGKRHHKTELYDCIEDDLANFEAQVRNHISDIRKKINPRAEDIIVEFYGRKLYYRLVRLIWPENRG